MIGKCPSFATEMLKIKGGFSFENILTPSQTVRKSAHLGFQFSPCHKHQECVHQTAADQPRQCHEYGGTELENDHPIESIGNKNSKK